MKRFATYFVALGLATAGSTAFAEQAKDPVHSHAPKAQPVPMTEAQLDNVAAGQLIEVLLIDVVDVNNNTVQVAIPVNANVNAAAAVSVLGTATAGAVQTLGNQTQRVFQ